MLVKFRIQTWCFYPKLLTKFWSMDPKAVPICPYIIDLLTVMGKPGFHVNVRD